MTPEAIAAFSKRIDEQRARELESLKHDNAILRGIKEFYETHQLPRIGDWHLRGSLRVFKTAR